MYIVREGLGMLDNHEDSNAEMYRRQLLVLSDKIAMLEQTVNELQGQLQQSYVRIQELYNEREAERQRYESFQDSFLESYEK